MKGAFSENKAVQLDEICTTTIKYLRGRFSMSLKDDYNYTVMDEKHIDEFKRLTHSHKNPLPEVRQQIGRDFETLINNVLTAEGIMLKSSYHTSNNKAEQVDAAIYVEGRIFLVEVKWVESNLAASDLFSFIGKIENKFHGTLGVFISRNPLTDNFIQSVNRGRRQSVIVVHGEDIDAFFQPDAPSFKDYLWYCFQVLSYDNKTHIPFKDFVSSLRAEDTQVTTVEESDKAAVDFIKGVLSLDPPIDKVKLESEVSVLSSNVVDAVIDFIVRNYNSIRIGLVRQERPNTWRNFQNFIDIVEPSQGYLKKHAQIYFSSILPSQLAIAFDLTILRWFEKYYSIVDKSHKDAFEHRVITVFDPKENNWDMENRLTSVIEVLWDKLDTNTHNKLMGIYLDIFVSSIRRKDFPQKKFASKLVDDNKIPRETIDQWLDAKIKQSWDAYEGTSMEELVITMASTYNSLRNALGQSEPRGNWVEYIRNKVQKYF